MEIRNGCIEFTGWSVQEKKTRRTRVKNDFET